MNIKKPNKKVLDALPQTQKQKKKAKKKKMMMMMMNKKKKKKKNKKKKKKKTQTERSWIQNKQVLDPLPQTQRNKRRRRRSEEEDIRAGDPRAKLSNCGYEQASP